jgi:hypothetical protein
MKHAQTRYPLRPIYSARLGMRAGQLSGILV